MKISHFRFEVLPVACATLPGRELKFTIEDDFGKQYGFSQVIQEQHDEESFIDYLFETVKRAFKEKIAHEKELEEDKNRHPIETFAQSLHEAQKRHQLR